MRDGENKVCTEFLTITKTISIDLYSYRIQMRLLTCAVSLYDVSDYGSAQILIICIKKKTKKTLLLLKL